MPIRETKSQSEPGTDSQPGLPIEKYLPYAAALLLVLAASGTGAAYYYYSQYSSLKTDPQKVAQQEVQALLAKVGNLIVLPTDEQPTVATVADPAKLKDQPFFARAQVGDKVLIYTNARKAILYNPTSDKIVEVAPLNIGATAGASTGE